MRRQRLRLDSFILGMLRDSATHEDRLFSLRTLKNFDISYDDGRLKVRNGYSRWNSTALADVAKQLFWFADLEQNEHLLAIANDLWFKIVESGAHTQISTEAATARRPVVQVGNRVFFGTDGDGSDIGFRWTDNTAIGAGLSYRAGIARPTVPPTLAAATPLGVTATPILGSRIELNATTQQKFASPFTLADTTRFGSIWMCISRRQNTSLEGNVRLKIYTDDSGDPSTTLADDNAISWEWPVQNLLVNFAGGIDDNTKRFAFPATIELAAGDYWAVLETDATYKTNFITANFNVEIHYDQPGSPTWGGSKWRNGNTSAWDATNIEPHMFIGGFDETKYYDYIYTYVNSTYQIESRASSPTRIKASNTPGATTVDHAVSSDAQVDKIRLYRREADNSDDRDEDILDTYKFVFEITEGDTYTDSQYTDELGAEIQTDDHYLFDETDDGDGDIRTSALSPEVATYWKSRIWFAEANDNKLYFSKILEKDGRTGLTGDSIPDFYPLDNRLEISESSDIIAIVPISADELAVYFRNTSIWVLRGSDDVLNPPADIVLRQAVTDVGLIAPAAVDSLRSRHVFVARKGVYTFTGTSAIEYLSNGIQTILDDIADSSLDDSVVVALGDSVWIAVDEDETADGKLNNIYILDIQRQPATWRLYNYGISVFDMVVRKTGTEYKTLLAADADNAYILKLEDGNDDNGEAIVAEAETQDLVAPNIATIFEVQIDAFYPNTPPSYEGIVTDSHGEEHLFEISPVEIDDLAGHKSGVLVPSAIGSRVKIIQRTVNQNHLRAIDIGFVEQ